MIGIDLVPASSVALAPSSQALFSSYKALVSRCQEVEAQGRRTIAMLQALDAIGELREPVILPAATGASGDRIALLEQWDRLALDLAEHAKLVAGVEAGRYAVRPSSSKSWDIDIGTPAPGEPTFAGLGFLPAAAAGLAVLGRLVLIGGGMALVGRALDYLEFRTKASLLEQGKDVSTLAPPPGAAAQVSSVTTPLAWAAVAVAGAVMLSRWKGGPKGGQTGGKAHG